MAPAAACRIVRFTACLLLCLSTTTTVVVGASSSSSVPKLGLHFAETHGDDMVLQRAPARAVVSGQLTLRYSMETIVDHNFPPPIVQVTLWRHARTYSSSSTASSTTSHELEPLLAQVASTPEQAYDSKQRSLLVWSFQADVPPMAASDDGQYYTIMARAILSPFMDPDGTSTTTQFSGPTNAKIAEEEDPLLHQNLYGVIFGDVWYCSGQSNMALPLEYTKSRKDSLQAVLAGTYDHVRIHSLQSNMNPLQQWSSPKDAVEEGSFLKFSSTCWYFMEGLAHELEFNNDMPPIPIGLIHTAWGGSKLEDWLHDDSLQKCNAASSGSSLSRSEDLLMARRFQEAVVPYKDLTIKGWVWYQGEANMDHTVLGNSLYHSGYSCLMVELVQSWRLLWSTTDPLAPFGVVALPASGSIGSRASSAENIGTMRWAQTGGYGVLPNPSMPHTFLVQAYDQDDPMKPLWKDCWMGGCCPASRSSSPSAMPTVSTCNNDAGPKPLHFACEECEDRCSAFCDDVADTPFYMGPIHPRTKQTVGSRLGIGAAQTAYGAALEKPTTGPTLAGCMLKVKTIRGRHSKLSTVMPMVTIRFNEALLAQDVVEVQAYNNQTNHPRLSQLEVLVGSTKLCLQKSPVNASLCVDDGYGQSFDMSEDIHQGWVPVDIVPESGPLNVQRRRRSYKSNYHHEITADLSGVQGSISAIRYAWQGNCCDTNGEEDPTKPCDLGSCPIISYPSGLPANPFLAKITKGRCECLPPQECNAYPVPTTEPEILLDTVVNHGYYWTQVSVLLALILAFLALLWILVDKTILHLKEVNHPTNDDDWVPTAPTTNNDDDQEIVLPDIT